MKPFFRFFVERHLIANLLTLMVLLLGLNTLLGIKRDSYPNVDYGYMHITTSYPGASPEDVEINVTNKIEKELRSVTGLKDMTSISMENTSFIRVVIDPNVHDEDKVQINVREAVNRVIDLPVEVEEAPLVEEIHTSLTPVLEVGITGDVPYRQLRDYARHLEKKLRDIDQVSRLDRFGFRVREVHIEVSPQRIRDYHVSLDEVIQAIKARNIRSTAGTFESFATEENIVTLAEFRDPQEVGDVIVRTTFDGPVVKIKDLGVIKDDFKRPTTYSRINGQSAISFMVYKKESADVIHTADAVKSLVAESGKNLPEGIRLSVATDYSHYVKNRFGVVLANALMGMCLVLIVLSVFLNLRAALWVGIGIPVSLLGAIFLMPFFGAFLDCLTLSAMIMVLGIIVDDAIIIGENIFKHRQTGKPAVDAAIDGVQEVFWPVMTTIVTTFCAFAPMFFIPGIMGKFVFVMPLVITFALLVSMFEVLIALPAHLAPGLEKTPATGPFGGSYDRDWFAKYKTIFKSFLKKCLPHRGKIVLGFCIVLALSLVIAKCCMDFVLLPSKMAQEIYIAVELPQGTALAKTSEKVKEIERIVETLPKGEATSYVTRVGEELFDEIKMENHAYVTINLTPVNKRKRMPQEIVEELRKRVKGLSGYEDIIFFIETGGPPVGKPINLSIVGFDDQRRQELSRQIVKFLKSMKGVKDVERGDKYGKSQIDLQPDYERLARLGLTVADVARNTRIAIDGEIVTSVRYDNEDVDFRVINDKKSRQEENYLSRLLIPNKDGKLVSLDHVVGFTKKPGYAVYQHYDAERAVNIYADVDKRKVAPMEVMNRLNKKFNLDRDFPGMRIIKGGELYETEKSLAGLARTFCIAVVAIYFLLIMLFQSFRQPLIVILAIPFGVIGVIWAFILHGEPLSFLGMLGVIGLSGVVVNDSLVLVNHINSLRKKRSDVDLIDIVVEGTANRLRAIVLTTLTTIVGLLPLVYGWGGIDPLVAPMALALGYGLLFATSLTLVLVPCLYLLLEK